MKAWELDLKYASVVKSYRYSKLIVKRPKWAVKRIVKRFTHSSSTRGILLTYKLARRNIEDNYALCMRDVTKDSRGDNWQEAATM